MRIATLAITAMLAVGVAFPAAAAKKRTISEKTLATFEECEKKAADMGLAHGQQGHNEYIHECMGMKPSSPSSERR
jgi:hypothetical protein